MKYEIMDKTHLSEISKIYAEAFNAPPWNDKWTIETVNKRLIQMMNCEGFFGLVCYDENSLCGMILGNTEYFFDSLHFQIKEFCVRLDLKGTGIGTKFLLEFERRLIENGINKVYLFTSRTNVTETFYEKRGYKSWNDMVIMGKTLHS